MISVLLSGAHLHDKWSLAPTLDAGVLKHGRGIRRPHHRCLDKDCQAAVRRRRITPPIRLNLRPGALPVF